METKNIVMTNAERIREFHRVMGSPQATSPIIPELSLLRMRQTLIDEEYEEVTVAFDRFIAALTKGHAIDLAPLIHELTDLLYVAYGAIQACGVDPDTVFAEVHRANMQKAGGPRRADGKSHPDGLPWCCSHLNGTCRVPRGYGTRRAP